MAQLKRSAKGVRRATKASSRANTARRAKAKTSGVIDGAMSLLPFTDEQLHRIFLAIILGGAVALAWFIASLAGIPAMAQAQVAGLASDAGFEVRRVRISGVERMNDQAVFDAVWKERNAATPMPLVNLEDIRERLLAMAWVSDARVSIQLPRTIAIDIVEREPHAVLKKPDRLMLIDAEGVELEPISKESAAAELTISGPGASRVVGGLDPVDERSACITAAGQGSRVGRQPPLESLFQKRTGSGLATRRGCSGESAGRVCSDGWPKPTDRREGGDV